MMDNSVGDGDIPGLEGQIVAERLVENGGGKLHGRSLALDDKVGGGGTVETNNVKTTAKAANRNFPLHGDKGGRIAPMAYQEVDDVLTHPFLGRENKIAATDDVENPQFPGGLFHLIIKWRKRQRQHSTGRLKFANLQQTAVAITQKTETMVEGVAINTPPIIADSRGHE